MCRVWLSMDPVAIHSQRVTVDGFYSCRHDGGTDMNRVGG